MNKLIEHAKREFQIAGWMDCEGFFDDDIQELICNHILDLLDVFSSQNHSGSSAPYTINLFSELAKFKIIAPLTGKDGEWIEIGENIFQNKRCSHVFKENGEAYDIDGRIFRDPNGCCYTSKDSRTPITFPYTPNPMYIDVEE